MKRPRQHVTEELAESVLYSSLPGEWVLRRQPKDYGIDLQLEIFSEGVSTGSLVEIQLKGTGRSVSAANPKLRFEVRHLLHYIRDRILPVVIVLVDVESEACWWISADQAAQALFQKNPDWSNQQTVTVEIPPEQKLPEALDELRAYAESELGIVRSLSEGVMVFSFDDYCFLCDRKIQVPSDIRLTFGLRLHGNGIGSQVVVGFTSLDSRGRLRRFPPIAEILVRGRKDAPHLAFRDISGEEEVLADGPRLSVGEWHEIDLSMSSAGSVTLSADKEEIECQVDAKSSKGSAIVIGSRVGGRGTLEAGLYGGIRNMHLYKDGSLLARWTFPRIDPCIDISGNRRYLEVPGQIMDRSVKTTNHPYRISSFSQEPHYP